MKQVRGHRMAKAALENAVWDIEAQMAGVALGKLLGRDAGEYSLWGFHWNSVFAGAANGEDYQGISGGVSADQVEMQARVGCFDLREGAESVAGNHAFVRRELGLQDEGYRPYRKAWDEFKLLMIEQPLWYDDFYFHSMLQKRIETSICLDESIRNRRDALAAIDMESCRIINIKVGRVGGFYRSDCGA